MSLNIQPFIFNWRGQYEKTCKIESDLLKIFDRVQVINSDEAHNKSEWTNIGESAYFAKQFLTAIELFDGDIFLHIQGDITFDRWAELVESAKEYYAAFNWGIYAPNVDYTWYNSSNADINTIQFTNHPNLKVVSNPDCTVWFIHKDIVDTLKNNPFDLSFTKIGWGLDLILCGNSFLQKRLVIRDYSYTVSHPQGTSYVQDQAFKEMNELISKCSPQLQEAINLIRYHKDDLITYWSLGA
jgi:hypothetical protein